MRHSHICTVALGAVVAAILFAGPVLSQNCDMPLSGRHIDPERTPIYASTQGEKAIFFTADLDVNTDGAARSYHPDDPRGTGGLALNNIANAITAIYDASGRNITCSPRSGPCYTRFIETFEAARDAGYDPAGHPRVETDHIIPWRFDPMLQRPAPCRIQSGPDAGYFVSQTAFIVNRNAAICDQSRYLDALAFNAVVLPRGVQWRSQGVITDGGDLVALLDAETGRLAFGMNGDRGPARAIGEGSVALAAELGGRSVPEGATYREVRQLKRPRVHYLIFPSRDVPRMTDGAFTQSDIDRLGADALAAFGGVERLRACAGRQ
jgi:hypothetical protein